MRRRALVASSLSLGTGSGLRARYMAAALERLGWEVRFVDPALPPLPFSLEMFLSLPRFILAGLGGGYDLALAVKPYPNAWLLLALARLRGALTVCDVDDHDGGYRGGLVAALTRALQAPAYALSARFSTHHPLLKAALRARLGRERVDDLAQGVDLAVFDAAAFGPRERRAWRAGLGLREEKVLLFAAHLNVACQFEEVLQRLDGPLRRKGGPVLVVAGGGPLEARFRRQAAPYGGRVRFTGALSPRQVALAMASADAGVSAYGPSPANQYRVPMKAAEYLAMGLPCATELLPGLAALRPYVEASAGGQRAFGTAVARALRGRAKARRGQAFVRRRLDWTGIMERWLSRRGLR